jgi:hypothetical protein
MQHRTTLLALAVVAGLSRTSIAAPLPAGSTHQPPVFLDLFPTSINLRSSDNRYVVDAEFVVLGGAENDRVRFDWRSGNKVLGTGTCKMGWSRQYQSLGAECGIEKLLSATGPIEIDVIYSDDQDDKDYLVATLKTNVKVWKSLDKRKVYGILPDDLLSVAFVRVMKTDTYYGAHDKNELMFDFWSTNDTLHSIDLRCTVDGKKLADIPAVIDRAERIAHEITFAKENRAYRYQRYTLTPRVLYGTDEFSKKSDDLRLADHPGAWECTARQEGKQVRQFSFVVDAAGMIDQSEMQQGARPHPVPGFIRLIEMKIPVNNGVELRLRPDANRKSIGFGMPWPDHPKAKQLQSSFPPAMGLPD